MHAILQCTWNIILQEWQHAGALLTVSPKITNRETFASYLSEHDVRNLENSHKRKLFKVSAFVN